MKVRQHWQPSLTSLVTSGRQRRATRTGIPLASSWVMMLHCSEDNNEGITTPVTMAVQTPYGSILNNSYYQYLIIICFSGVGSRPRIRIDNDLLSIRSEFITQSYMRRGSLLRVLGLAQSLRTGDMGPLTTPTPRHRRLTASRALLFSLE